MSFRIAALPLLLSLTLFYSGCARKTDGKATRIAVFAFDNLSSDPSLDWAGRALGSLVLARTPGGDSPQTVDGNERSVGSATHTLSGYVTGSRSQMRIKAFLRDSAENVVRSVDVSGPSSDVGRLADELARSVIGRSVSLTSPKPEALESYYAASNSSNRDESVALLQRAIQLDAAYAPSYFSLAQILAAGNEKDRAQAVLQSAEAASGRFTQEEKAQLALLRATVAGSRSDRAASTLAAARLRPADVDLWRSAAELSYEARHFSDAVEAFRRALDVTPEEATLWNLLGYSQAYAGDLRGAVQSLEQYRKLAPDDANVSDSLGEVHYMHGQFAAAARYFGEAFDRNQSLLGGGEALRAAFAHLMAGDRAAADREFARYIAFRQKNGDRLIPVRQAIWQFSTGKRAEAIGALEGLTGSAEIVVPARLMLSLWSVQMGDLPRARQYVEDAARLPASPASTNLLAVGRFMLSPPQASDQIGGNPNDPVRRQIMGYRLLFHQHWAEAARLWREAYGSAAASTAEEERTLLAWAEAQRGNSAEVSQLMRTFPSPPRGLDPGFSATLFPRSLYLKGLAEQHSGNKKEAVRLFQLFLDYSGERAFIYGEEKQARESLGR